MDANVVIRKYCPGDPSVVAGFQMKLYERQYGFKPIFEYYLVAGMADFLKEPTGSQLWVAELDGKIVGSIAIVRESSKAAHLRWFGVEESLQGRGIGKMLVNTAMQFCSESGYDDVTLWTIEILKAARHLYGKQGFVLTETKQNTEWTNHTLIEEKWEYHNR